MKNWFKLPGSRVVVTQNYKTVGTRFWNFSKVSWAGFQYFYRDRTTPSYLRIVAKHSILLSKKRDFTKIDYYDPILMGHVRKHLPKFENFSTNFYTFLLTEWNPIYGDTDWQSIGKIIVVEEELYQRDRLLQLFGACSPGSYGYYAEIALTPFKFAVQSFAADKIDEFFASVIQLVKQPYGPEINGIMTALESSFWYSLDQKEKFIEWAAGQLLSQDGRTIPPWLVVQWETYKSGKLREPTKGGDVLTAQQLREIEDVVIEVLPILNSGALKGLTKVLGDLFDQKMKEKLTGIELPKEGPELSASPTKKEGQ
jgi:hypothetical protein